MRIAVVGSGISGLTAAWLLSRKHDVELSEARMRLGGPTHTVRVDGPRDPVGLDTGFMIFTRTTYPVLTRLVDQLGHENLATWFAACDRLLGPGGTAAVQVITIPDQRYAEYRRGSDFILRYIFPGLRRWRNSLVERRRDVHDMGLDAEFFRRWEYYLADCEAAFASRILSDLQIVLARTGSSDLGIAPYRSSLA